MIVIENPSLKSSHSLTNENFRNLLLWKPRIGEAVTVCSADKRFFRARITRLEHDRADILLFEAFDGKVESNLEIMLLQALPERERMEMIIQKTTELGVSSVVPFKSKRSISLAELDARQKKSHKWNDIALKAARQSRRATIPRIHKYCSFDCAMGIAADYDLKLVVWENEKANNLKQIIQHSRNAKRIAIMVGPEGGFEEKEMEDAQREGFMPVSLGSRILRAETAAIITVGLIQYESGMLG